MFFLLSCCCVPCYSVLPLPSSPPLPGAVLPARLRPCHHPQCCAGTRMDHCPGHRCVCVVCGCEGTVKSKRRRRMTSSRHSISACICTVCQQPTCTPVCAKCVALNPSARGDIGVVLAYICMSLALPASSCQVMPCVCLCRLSAPLSRSPGGVRRPAARST